MQIFRLSLHLQDEQVLAVPSVLGKPGVNAHACNAIIQEAKARGSWVGDRPRLPGLKAAWDTQPATVLQKQNKAPWGLPTFPESRSQQYMVPGRQR